MHPNMPNRSKLTPSKKIIKYIIKQIYAPYVPFPLCPVFIVRANSCKNEFYNDMPRVTQSFMGYVCLYD